MSRVSLVLANDEDKEEQEKAKEKKLSSMRYSFTCVTDFTGLGKNVEPASRSKMYESKASHKSENSEIPETREHPSLSTAIMDEKKIRLMVPLDAITNETSEMREPDNHPPLSSVIINQKGSNHPPLSLAIINQKGSIIFKPLDKRKSPDSESDLDSNYLRDSYSSSTSVSCTPSSSYERDLKKAKQRAK